VQSSRILLIQWIVMSRFDASHEKRKEGDEQNPV